MNSGGGSGRETGKAQRAYRAACPGCGAPVEFRSAASTHAVCGYCSSTVVRQGDELQRIGKMAELFDDFSPLQLFATGVFEQKPFTIVGRLQYAWKDGGWSEWHCSFDGEQGENSTGWLSEDNGQFVFMRESAMGVAPDLSSLRVGMSTAVQGKRYQITAITRVHLRAAQGELPKMPPLNREFAVVELRADDGSVLSLDYGQEGGGARAYFGFGVTLPGLQLKGLKDATDKEEKKTRQFGCPNCGAPVEVKLEGTKAITCGSCASVIDVSQGENAAFVSAMQSEPVRPTIALGKAGKLNNVDWQVVGFQHRMGQEAGDDEQFGWDEYLLYNRIEGFAFLVDASDGWSLVRPLTGAPEYRAGAQVAKYLGKNYQKKYNYDAETTYVAGEFYWRATRGARSQNTDFSNGNVLLSREQSKAEGTEEVTWSRGNTVDSDVVAKAFGLEDSEDMARDVSPVSSGMSAKTIIILIVLFLIVLLLLSRCSSKNDCNPERENCNSSYRSGTSGGSYGGGGGFGGGSSGGHK